MLIQITVVFMIGFIEHLVVNWHAEFLCLLGWGSARKKSLTWNLSFLFSGLIDTQGLFFLKNQFTE